MLDEREGPVPAADLARSFTRRPHWQRIVVLLAGPAFNILFAVLVLWGMLWASGTTEVQPDRRGCDAGFGGGARRPAPAMRSAPSTARRWPASATWCSDFWMR